MAKNMINSIKKGWNKFFSPEKRGLRDIILYFVGFFVLAIIIFEGLYLWHYRETPRPAAEKKAAAREENGMAIGQAQKDDPAKTDREIQGTADSGFESALFASKKNLVVKNAEAKVSKDQFHLGKNSLQVDWKEGQNKFVQLSSYLTVQKGKYYKLGLWISSAEDSQLKLFIVNGDGFFPIADVGVIKNDKNSFRYYEYNFRSPADASALEFFMDGGKFQTIFVDDIKLLPLSIGNDEELASIRPTMRGDSYGTMIGEQQLLHPENSDALSVPKTLLGQVFSAGSSDLVGATFFLAKKGDGGTGDYALEIREFDEKTQLILPQKIAVKTFSSKEVAVEANNFPIFAKLEAGKKYWIGFNNSAVKASKDNYLAVGQAGSNAAYSDGDGFLQNGANQFLSEQKDLYFATTYAEPVKADGTDLSYGETLYDLGQGKKRLDYSLDPANGSNILDIYGQKNITIDKWNNIALRGDNPYLVYKIGVGGKKVKGLTLNDVVFHNNIHIALSTDSQKWTEIFSDNSGKLWQNSGQVKVEFKKDTQDIFIKMKKYGDKDNIFLGGYAILDLVD
jgi:hypothetical protein